MNMRTKAYLWLFVWFLASFFIILFCIVEPLFLILLFSFFILHVVVSYRFLRCPRCKNPVFRTGPYGLWTPFIRGNCGRCGYPLDGT